jgi:hypothetical protein
MALAGVSGTALTTNLFAGTFSDDFATGLNPTYWSISQSTPGLYSVNATGSNVVLALPNPGLNPGGLQSVQIVLDLAALGGSITGDFTVQIVFTNAVIGPNDDQVQLNLVFADSSIFDDVYDLSSGRNVHVWNGSYNNPISETVTFGTFTIIRTGSTVTGYFDGTPIFFESNSAALTALTFSLQNQPGAAGDTPSVTFDNFSLTADSVPATCVPPPTGLVSWWPGDGNANDISGGNNGILSNGTTFATGEVGQAFSFDGVDDQVVVPHNANQNTGSQITIDAWVKPTSSGHPRPILQKRSSANVGGYTFETTNSPFDPVNGLQFGIWIGGTLRLLQTPANVLTNSTWQHVAATYDGTVMKIYVNGVEQASLAQTGAIDAVTDPIVIGRNVVVPADAWDGLIDEIELLNRALSSNEVAAIFNAGSAGKCKPCVTPPLGLVSWWSGDGNANDIIGGNAGTLQNGTTFAPGLVGQAFSFNGTNQYVDVPTAPSLNPGAGSFSSDAWIFPTLDQAGTILAKWGDAGNFTNQRAYIFQEAISGQLQFSISDDAHQNDGSFHQFLTPTNVLTINAWNHVAAVYDHSTGTRLIYVNGVQVASRQDAPITITASTADFSIGEAAFSVAPGVPFTGLIDEVEFFNRALTQTEIQSIVDAGSAGKCKPTCTPPPSGLVSWWPGDGNANDIISGNNGMVEGSVTFPAGEVAQAFSFDGTTADVKVPASTSLNVGAGSGMTIDAWLNPASISEDAPLVEWNTGTTNGAHFWMSVNPPGVAGSLFANFVDTDGTSHIVYTSQSVLTANIYQHVALTYDKTNGDVAIYVNGQPVSMTSTNLGIFTPQTTYDLYLGRRPAGAPSPALFSGQLDEVEIFNRALSSNEVAAIFNAGSAGKCKPSAMNQPPVAICQNVMKTADANCQATVLATEVDNGSSDPDGTITNRTLTPPGPYSLGPNQVILTVTDDQGASATCAATVTVVDHMSPMISQCATSLIASANANCQAAIPNFAGNVTASDNCTVVGALTKTQAPSAGTLVGLGSNAVVITVVDGSGNSNTCATSFIVKDTTPPTIMCPANITTNVGVDATSAVVNYNPPIVSDNCGVASSGCSPPAGTTFDLGTNG